MTLAQQPSGDSPAGPWLAVRMFAAFAFAYFFSAMLRAVTATLAPRFSADLGLTAADLGLLAGAYFLGFSALQLPLGAALDRLGPRRVILSLTVLAVVGCAAFALAQSLWALVAARVLIGMGVSAGLMAPLTCYRRRFSPPAQLRANSWMLMTGSLGMLASTLPVQWMLPAWGWRGVFWAAAAGLAVAIALMAWAVPRDPATTPSADGVPPGSSRAVGSGGYGEIFRHPAFVRSMPVGFFVYGGLIAVQALWAGPWLTRVAGWTSEQAAGGLFTINLCMLFAFMGWGMVMPRLASRGLGADRLMAWGLPLNLIVLAVILLWPHSAGAGIWALWCVSCTVVSLSQPAIGQAFPVTLAGRALSAFNLVIFGGVFCLQWGIGLAIDALQATGLGTVSAFQGAFGIFWLCCLASVLWFLKAGRPGRSAT